MTGFSSLVGGVLCDRRAILRTLSPERIRNDSRVACAICLHVQVHRKVNDECAPVLIASGKATSSKTTCVRRLLWEMGLVCWLGAVAGPDRTGYLYRHGRRRLSAYRFTVH